jgi:uncharacterized protein (DUF362 family)
MNPASKTDRRAFLKTSLLGGAAALASHWSAAGTVVTALVGRSDQVASRVAFTYGEDRAELAFKGLMAFQKDIDRAIGKKQVIIKPNNVAIDNQLSASHAQNLEGILEFLKSIGKTNVLIAESAANGPTLDGFTNYGYDRLASKYGSKLVDLDQAGFEIVHCFDETDFQPHPCRMSKVLLDPNRFIISAAKFKTHDRVVATLSLKNIVVGAPIKDPGFRWDPKSRAGARNDKPITHGNGFRGINYNLYALASRLHPHLSVIDGFEGMEGEGPVGGTPVAHRVCVVSQDWLAADRVALELMGIDFTQVGYLNYCARAGLGETDLTKIDIVGPALRDHIKTYKLAANLQEQLVWRQKNRA